MGNVFDVSRLHRRIRRVDPGLLSIELSEIAVVLGVACNVIELSPRERIESGSTVHERMLDALDRLDAKLDELLDEPQLDVAA